MSHMHYFSMLGNFLPARMIGVGKSRRVTVELLFSGVSFQAFRYLAFIFIFLKSIFDDMFSSCSELFSEKIFIACNEPINGIREGPNYTT